MGRYDNTDLKRPDHIMIGLTGLNIGLYLAIFWCTFWIASACTVFIPVTYTILGVLFGLPVILWRYYRTTPGKMRVSIMGTSIIAVLIQITLIVTYEYVSIQGSAELSKDLHFPGLNSPVKITHDSEGIIHISADTVDDLYFAQGIVSAQMRLFQMDFQRHIGRGQLSQFLQSHSNPKVVELDTNFRTFGLYEASTSAWEQMKHTEAGTSILKFCDGINAYLESGDRHRPIEMLLLGIDTVPWTPADVLVWIKVMNYQLAFNADVEALRYYLHYEKNLDMSRIDQLIPEYDSSKFTVSLSADDLATSPNITTELHWETAKKESKPFNLPKASHTKISAGDWLSKSIDSLHAKYLNREVGRTKASNNWVIHGQKSDSGKPILANDPHLDMPVPSLWILMHLHVPKKLDVIGAALAGVPGIVIGHNRHISWGVTNTGADVQDLIELSLNPTNSSEYLLDGEFIAFKERLETIGNEEVIIRSSIFGPVVNDVFSITPRNEKALVLRWTALETTDTTYQSLYNLNRAHDWVQFNEALRGWVGPIQNFVYADAVGNIGYLMPGKIPVRLGEQHLGKFPVEKDTSTRVWNGYIPFEDLPRAYNPAKGFIVTANNQIVPKEYPHFITRDWDALDEGYRASRITEMILKTPNITIADVAAIQTDYLSSLARDFVPLLQNIEFANLGSIAWKKRLLDWDFVMNPGQPEAAVFARWYDQICRLPSIEVDHEFWNFPGYLLKALNSTSSHCQEKGYSSCTEFLHNSFDYVVEQIGGGKKPWGDVVHRAEFRHSIFHGSPLDCLACRSSVHGGDRSTVNVGGYDQTDSAKTQTEGPSFRMIIDMANFSNNIAIFPIGQSENSLSIEFDRYLRKWTENSYVHMRIDEYSDSPRFSQTLEPNKL